MFFYLFYVHAILLPNSVINDNNSLLYETYLRPALICTVLSKMRQCVFIFQQWC